ncbi:LacI family transcriptional regulator [Actinomycetaceae bacterium TAE3-ERU4]|nr:LacI family transcriptional regulator [Actinomycetaceae bacterium TAE3-ERU4]
MMNAHKGDKKPTSRDVAALANVAQSTVSYVLSGRRNVSPETEKRVLEAIKQLNYQPNAGARTLRTARTNVIALGVHLDEKIDARETAPYIRAIIKEARKHDYDVILSPLEGGAKDLTRLASRSICDAIIMMDISINDERIHTASNLSVPTILMGRPKNNENLDVVDFDTFKVGQELIEELYQTGHTAAIAVGEDRGEKESFQFVSDFYEGLKSQSEKRNIDLQIVPRPNSRWDGFMRIADQLIPKDNKVTGIVARTPKTAEWVLRLLESRGFTPGTDISVVAYCPDTVAVSYPRPVTNICGNVNKICQQAVQIALAKIKNPYAPADTYLIAPERLQRRATTRTY